MVQSEELRAKFVARLKRALANAGIAEWGAGARLAKITGVTPKATSKWINADSMPSRSHLLAIAKELQVSAEWLQYGDGHMEPDLHTSDSVITLKHPSYERSNVAPAQESHRKDKEYPLISWVAAGCWQEACDNFHPGDAEQWIASDANAGPHGYWLTVKGPSMQPTFMEGSRILVKPEGFDLVSGKFYIAKLMDTGETTFKQYIRDGGIGFLQPLNSAFPIMQITDNVQIIGQVVDGRLPPIF